MVNVALTALLPKGIRLRKGKKNDSLIVQTRKRVVDAKGKEHVIADAQSRHPGASDQVNRRKSALKHLYRLSAQYLYSHLKDQGLIQNRFCFSFFI